MSPTLLVTSKPIDHVPSTFTRKAVMVLLMTRLDILAKEEAIATTTAGVRVRLTWLADLDHWYV